MNKRDYRFEKILALRERAKKEAEIQLFNSRKFLNIEETNLQNLFIKLDENRKLKAKSLVKLRVELNKPHSPQKLLIHKNYLADIELQKAQIQEAICEQKKIIEQKLLDVKKATENAIKASNDLRVFEKHKGRWEEEKNLNRLKQEKKEEDELNLTLHQNSEKL